ncbi:hypothetical protein B0G77_8033 [Paraburkholderia sp. BL10I2N1]|nr:hypothetical protein B0G77_8033 [Paraburkholderia sp. BL10I2N1]
MACLLLVARRNPASSSVPSSRSRRRSMHVTEHVHVRPAHRAPRFGKRKPYVQCDWAPVAPAHGRRLVESTRDCLSRTETSCSNHRISHRQSDGRGHAETGAEAISLIGTTAGGFCDTCFTAGAFLVTDFFAAGFLTATFFAVAGSVPALTLFAATFLPATFVVVVFPTVTALAGADFGVEASFPAAAIRNFERSLAPASHAGAGPRPLHVAPLLGSRYLGAWGPLT